MHNVVTHDGTPPAEFRAAARKELAAYDTVDGARRRGHLGGARDGDGFVVALGARWSGPAAVVLATGVRRHAARQARAGRAVRLGGRALPVLPRPRVRRPATSASSARPARGHLPGLVGRSPRGSRCSPTAQELDRRAARGRRGPHRPGDRRLPQPGRRRRVSFADGPTEEVGGPVRLHDAQPAGAVRRAARPGPATRRAASRSTRWAAPACPACTPPATWPTSPRCRCRWTR